jgi:Lsr2
MPYYGQPEELARTEIGMSQKRQTVLIDDLDGSAAEGTVLFGLDGTHYEIDLNTDHAKELRATLAHYIEAGRRITSTARRARRNVRTTGAGDISNTDVRTWAKAHGIDVKERGRIPADVLDRYRAATSN